MDFTVGESAGETGLSTSPCNLCPRLCGAMRDEGKKGACGADGSMRIARAALHFWEEPPISGSSGSGTVFFGGCPLHCIYCQNAVIAKGDIGREVSVERLAEICLELQVQGALNVNFVTPTHHSLAIIGAVEIARNRGLSIPIVWNTSGYERIDCIRALAGTVDVYLTDFKYADADAAARYSHAPDYPQIALDAIEAMLEQVGDTCFEEAQDSQVRMKRGIIVRHLVLPGHLDNSKRSMQMLFERFGDRVLYSIMNQYTPVISGAALDRFPELGASVPTSEYEELLDFADALGIEDYFWQDGPADESSFIPAWDGTGV